MDNIQLLISQVMSAAKAGDTATVASAVVNAQFMGFMAGMREQQAITSNIAEMIIIDYIKFLSDHGVSDSNEELVNLVANVLTTAIRQVVEQSNAGGIDRRR